MTEATEIRVCMDIGNRKHHVAIGLSTGKLLENFELDHTPLELITFFKNRILSKRV